MLLYFVIQESIKVTIVILSYYSHFGSDTFDENTPPVDDPNYISSLGAAIYHGIQSGDDDAIWLMQVAIAFSVAKLKRPNILECFKTMKMEDVML